MSHGNCLARKFEYFPSEILIEILIRLPVQTLARAKLACKTWHAIISNSEFVDLHLKHSRKYPGYLYTFHFDLEYFTESSRFAPDKLVGLLYPLYLIIQRSKVSSIDANKAENQKIKIKMREGPKLFLNSSGGLVAYTSNDNNNDFCYVCNPIIGEEIRLEMHYFWGEGFHINYCGLGFSPSSNEYKILLLVSPLTPRKTIGQVSKGVIYTLGPNSAWREIPGDIPYFFYGLARLCIDFEGSLFWIVSRYCDWDGPKRIVSFDVGSEGFKLWNGPDTNTRVDCLRDVSLLLVGETVAFSQIHNHNSISIWMLRDMINETWVKEIKIDAPEWDVFPDYTFFGHWGNENVLLYWRRGLPKYQMHAYYSKQKRPGSLAFPFVGNEEVGAVGLRFFFMLAVLSLPRELCPRRLIDLLPVATDGVNSISCF